MNKLTEIKIIKLRENEEKIHFLASASVNAKNVDWMYINYEFEMSTAIFKYTTSKKTEEQNIRIAAKVYLDSVCKLKMHDAKITIEGL